MSASSLDDMEVSEKGLETDRRPYRSSTRYWLMERKYEVHAIAVEKLRESTGKQED
jgi:hypothetical protein